MAGKRPVKTPAPKGTGRPTSYTEELGDRICERIIQSDYGLEQICQDKDIPHASTVYRWLATNEAFRERYARAKVLQGSVQADRGLRDALDATDAQLGRLKFDARKWAAAKLAPKLYGDSVQLKHADADGERLPPDETQISARMAALLALAGHRKAADEGE